MVANRCCMHVTSPEENGFVRVSNYFVADARTTQMVQ
jgi:hypothetical protein